MRRGIGRGAGLGIAAVTVAAIGLAIARRRPGAPAHVVYPPINTPKPIADGVWVVDGGPLHTRSIDLPVRMTVVRLANGDLLLHSPTHFAPDLARALEAIGPVRHLVAPNIAHWMFVAEWQRAYPQATSWGAPGLRERAPVKQSDVRIDEELGTVAPPAWAGEISQGVITGAAGFSEVWFFHKPSRTLLLTDLISNLRPDKLPPATRLLMRAAAATSGVTARYLRPVLRWNGDEARAAVRAMITLDPERVVLAHGDIFADRGAARLRAAFAWLW